jgi:hypothetical protein
MKAYKTESEDFYQFLLIVRQYYDLYRQADMATRLITIESLWLRVFAHFRHTLDYYMERENWNWHQVMVDPFSVCQCFSTDLPTLAAIMDDMRQRRTSWSSFLNTFPFHVMPE